MEWVRNNRRWAQIILIALIVPFACTGVAQLRNMQNSDDAAAKVGRLTISRAELDRAVAQQMEQFRGMVGANFNPAMFDTPEMRRGVLDTLVAQRAMEQEVDRLGVRIGDGQLRDFIMNLDMFKLNGSFSKEYYDDFRTSRQQTEAQLDAAFRNDLVTRTFAQLPQQSSVVPNSVLDTVSALYAQERSVVRFTLEPAAYTSQVKLGDEQIASYYEANKSQFQKPQSVDVQYVVLSAGHMGETVKISDADLNGYYQSNKQRFTTPEQRRASHILFVVDSSASPEQRAAVRAKAEKVLAEVKAHPADFAKLAAQYSEDPGSKEHGGDLDYATKGNTWVKPFEDAVFSMNKGQISDLVQSDFGYHIIELTDIRPGVSKTLAEVRPQLEDEIRTQQGARAMAEQTEAFTNTVYEQPDSLDPAAQRFDLKVETAQGVTRSGSPVNSAFVSQRLVDAVFSDDVLKNHRNTPAIETSPGTLVSARVTEVHPAETRPLAEVRDQIVEQLTKQESAKLAQKTGESMLADLRAGKTPAGVNFGAPGKVTLQSSSYIAPQTLRDVFKVSAQQPLPAYIGADLGERGGYQIVRVDAVKEVPAAQAAASRASTGEQIKGTIAEAEMRAFIDSVKQGTKITVNDVKAPE
jgi:peptidyl-prolyl cis-trans isomerase D